MDQHLNLVEASRRLSEALAPDDLDRTLERITAAAVEVLPDVEYASITVKHADGRLETFAPTDQLICDLDAAQYDLLEGPCYDAATETMHAAAPYLATDSRFPAYGPIAAAAGIEAQAGIRLYDSPASNGALNLYSTRPGVFEDLTTVGQLFAHQAAVALSYARQIDQLQQAVETRQLIGQAVGVIMERFDLSDARAFSFLTRLSQDTNVKLRVLAQRLLDERSNLPQDADSR
ncbi:GAF and ANTAR domain-containing protein [Nocardioides sp.]|uniref:GAF and ANTAR domain-containing protein n=1 Tax=Nocardioides sp. TaxID=35761 RepID=UPI002B85DF16|nr:GAF and ANTAR domain-containing protein [Nocardioides sp.]HXH77531.1 GAF and ANTAR domain-containing protein [Nocardioides sp.]